MKQPDLQISTQSKIADAAGKVRETTTTKTVHLNSGWLGKIFGGAESAPTNICGLTIILIIITGIVITFYGSKIEPIEYWRSVALPLLTGILTYIFAKNKS